jgi:glycosyltransferase involved in cell wall biosynthesis
LEKISIGLLAHNEGPRIGETLRSLLNQDVFRQFSTEVVVVANGCSDDTANIARRLLEENRTVWEQQRSSRVEEMAQPGKANAWNCFVHHYSASDATLLILMDADISFAQNDTLSSMVRTLRTHPDAVVCVDTPVKDIEVKGDATLFERMLVTSSPKIDPHDVPLCGQLYCAVASSLREIKIPVEITCEDGFLRALLLTHGFTKPENRQRIVWARDAAHFFSSVGSVRELYNHEKWLVAGCIVDMLLFELFSTKCGAHLSAMQLMERYQQCDPNWMKNFVRSEVARRRWKLLPRPWWIRRWLTINKLPWTSRFRRTPVAILASLADWFIFLAAIHDVHRGHAFRYWGRKW